MIIFQQTPQNGVEVFQDETSIGSIEKRYNGTKNGIKKFVLGPEGPDAVELTASDLIEIHNYLLG